MVAAISKKASAYLPLRTICKFYRNHQTNHPNRIFSKTLMKATFIDHAWLDDHPQDLKPSDGEFWIVDVVSETASGQGKGCFLAHPVRKIEPVELVRLLPGMYEETDNDGCLIILPKTEGQNWIMPLRHKQSISPKDRKGKSPYAIIVSL
jgi:hypothetical protein